MSFIIKTREKTITQNGQSILYGINKNKANYNKLREFFSKRIYKNEQILEADDGLYTWILKNSGNIYIAKTFTKQEIGTLHINLNNLTNSSNASDVYAAGELEILKEGYINFNLLSGTYMVPKFKKKDNAEKMKLRNEIVSKFINILMKRYGIKANFIESDASEEEKLGGKKIIEGAEIKTSPENIEMLNSLFKRVNGGKHVINRKINYTCNKRKGMKIRKTRKRF
jgi:hypothetical protein